MSLHMPMAPARCLTKAQHCMPLISTMHWQLFLTPLPKWFCGSEWIWYYHVYNYMHFEIWLVFSAVTSSSINTFVSFDSFESLLSVCLLVRLSVHLSVHPSIYPSLCEDISTPIIMIFYPIRGNTYCLWFSNFHSHRSNFKVKQANNFVKWVKFWAISGEHMGEWPEIWHADLSWPSSEMIRLWSWSVDFPHIGCILTYWNRSNLGFLSIFCRTHCKNCLKLGMLVYPDRLWN